MPKIAYKQTRFNKTSKAIIAIANEILNDYWARGYDLTLRQLYYQFVAKAIIYNKESEYNRLKNVVNNARLAGLIDWNHITDRTRNLRRNSFWSSPEEGVKALADQYQIDKWKNQKTRVECFPANTLIVTSTGLIPIGNVKPGDRVLTHVNLEIEKDHSYCAPVSVHNCWIEKDALVGVIAPICSQLDLPYFSCRGYTSQSEMWVAARRMEDYNQDVVVLHLGDHDPSGIDMTRDIQERLDLFTDEGMILVKRIALTMEQIDQYDPPPNPCKITDSRAPTYVAEYGNESWELNALDPDVMVELIEAEVEKYRDDELWAKAEAREKREKNQLLRVAKNWTGALKGVKK